MTTPRNDGHGDADMKESLESIRDQLQAAIAGHEDNGRGCCPAVRVKAIAYLALTLGLGPEHMGYVTIKMADLAAEAGEAKG